MTRLQKGQGLNRRIGETPEALFAHDKSMVWCVERERNNCAISKVYKVNISASNSSEEIIAEALRPRT